MVRGHLSLVRGEDRFVTRMGDGRCTWGQGEIFSNSPLLVVPSAPVDVFSDACLTVYVVWSIDTVDSGGPPTVIDTVVERGVGVVRVKIKKLAGVRRIDSAPISRGLFRGIGGV